eukprot:4472351-Pleurochrysis_carterae.AAC.2
MRVGDDRFVLRSALNEAMNVRTWVGASCLCLRRWTALNLVLSSTSTRAYLRAPSTEATKGPAKSTLAAFASRHAAHEVGLDLDRLGGASAARDGRGSLDAHRTGV